MSYKRPCNTQEWLEMSLKKFNLTTYTTKGMFYFSKGSRTPKNSMIRHAYTGSQVRWVTLRDVTPQLLIACLTLVIWILVTNNLKMTWLDIITTLKRVRLKQHVAYKYCNTIAYKTKWCIVYTFQLKWNLSSPNFFPKTFELMNHHHELI